MRNKSVIYTSIKVYMYGVIN